MKYTLHLFHKDISKVEFSDTIYIRIIKIKMNASYILEN